MISAQSPLQRPLAALRRYKLLIIAIVLVAVAGGIVATRMVTPQYEVRATIWIESQTPLQDRAGPIRSHELLNAAAWVELLKSYRISDAVVRKLSLYIRPEKAADSTLFATFSLADRLAAGTYDLDIHKTKKRWTLTLPKLSLSDSGAAAASARKLGGSDRRKSTVRASVVRA